MYVILPRNTHKLVYEITYKNIPNCANLAFLFINDENQINVSDNYFEFTWSPISTYEYIVKPCELKIQNLLLKKKKKKKKKLWKMLIQKQ